MHESTLHQHIFARSANLSVAYPNILIGPGDDCAVIKTNRGDHLLLKVDQLVEHRHFTPDTPIDLIARKAIVRTISDIAAMAGTPTCALAAVVLPPNYPHADELFDRLAHWTHHFGAPLVGGDIATGPPDSPLALTISLIGTPHPTRGPVLRATARPGDELWVTGRIGNSLVSQHHLTFQSRLAEAAWLADMLGNNLTAMIDISDGLGRDAARIAAASGVRIVIEGPSVPLSEGATDIPRAAAEGEDYELLFTTSPGAMTTAHARWQGNPPMTRIGRAEPGAGCVLTLANGTSLDASTLGWDH